MMRCPECRDEFRPGVKRCPDCGIDLVPSSKLAEAIIERRARGTVTGQAMVDESSDSPATADPRPAGGTGVTGEPSDDGPTHSADDDSDTRVDASSRVDEVKGASEEDDDEPQAIATPTDDASKQPATRRDVPAPSEGTDELSLLDDFDPQSAADMILKTVPPVHTPELVVWHCESLETQVLARLQAALVWTKVPFEMDGRDLSATEIDEQTIDDWIETFESLPNHVGEPTIVPSGWTEEIQAAFDNVGAQLRSAGVVEGEDLLTDRELPDGRPDAIALLAGDLDAAAAANLDPDDHPDGFAAYLGMVSILRSALEQQDFADERFRNMVDLHDAAQKLASDPKDLAAFESFASFADATDASAPPFGISVGQWGRVIKTADDVFTAYDARRWTAVSDNATRLAHALEQWL